MLESSGSLLKKKKKHSWALFPDFLIQQAWDEVLQSASLTSCQVMLMLVVLPGDADAGGADAGGAGIIL